MIYPVRNNAPLLCSGVGFYNNSGGVSCPAGISNGVYSEPIRINTKHSSERNRKEFNTCKRFGLFAGDKSERNLYVYQRLGYKIFKTSKITDQADIVYLEKYM